MNNTKRVKSIEAPRCLTSASPIYVGNLPARHRRTHLSAWRWDDISFNGALSDELLNGESLYSLKEVRIVIEHWRREYNEVRLHSVGYRQPAPAACRPKSLVRAQP